MKIKCKWCGTSIIDKLDPEIKKTDPIPRTLVCKICYEAYCEKKEKELWYAQDKLGEFVVKSMDDFTIKGTLLDKP